MIQYVFEIRKTVVPFPVDKLPHCVQLKLLGFGLMTLRLLRIE